MSLVVNQIHLEFIRVLQVIIVLFDRLLISLDIVHFFRLLHRQIDFHSVLFFFLVSFRFGKENCELVFYNLVKNVFFLYTYTYSVHANRRRSWYILLILSFLSSLFSSWYKCVRLIVCTFFFFIDRGKRPFNNALSQEKENKAKISRPLYALNVCCIYMYAYIRCSCEEMSKNVVKIETEEKKTVCIMINWLIHNHIHCPHKNYHHHIRLRIHNTRKIKENKREYKRKI
jgi:hypothetical protein